MMNSSLQIKLAQKASRNPGLLARLVAVQLESEHQSWEESAQSLGITVDQLTRLSLCNRPRANQFVKDAAQIAEYVKINRDVLIAFIRRSEAIEQMQLSEQQQWLMAARDKDPGGNDDYRGE